MIHVSCSNQLSFARFVNSWFGINKTKRDGGKSRPWYCVTFVDHGPRISQEKGKTGCWVEIRKNTPTRDVWDILSSYEKMGINLFVVFNLTQKYPLDVYDLVFAFSSRLWKIDISQLSAEVILGRRNARNSPKGIPEDARKTWISEQEKRLSVLLSLGIQPPEILFQKKFYLTSTPADGTLSVDNIEGYDREFLIDHPEIKSTVCHVVAGSGHDVHEALNSWF